MRYILLCIIAASLASCGYQKPIVIVPTDEALAECTISPPPVLTGIPSKDKVVLAGAWSMQTNNLGACNRKLKMLQAWKKINQERFGSKN